MNKLALGVMAALAATPASAWPTLANCGWQASAQYLVEPWFENTVTFSDGLTRVALLDTVEPASEAFGLLILSPPFGPTGERTCHVLQGFSGLSLEGMATGYDPSIGLQLSLTGQVYLEDEGQFASAQVDIIINQGTGEIDHFITPYID